MVKRRVSGVPYEVDMDVDIIGRPTRDEYFTAMARLVSTRGACVRRQTGCVLVDKNYFVLATGYNGRPAGMENCLSRPCAGATASSGTALHACEAIHAEANALLQCKDTQTIEVAYCTTSPCIHCIKLLANTSVKRIVFLDEYPHPEAKDFAEKLGIKWEKFTNDDKEEQPNFD